MTSEAQFSAHCLAEQSAVLTTYRLSPPLSGVRGLPWDENFSSALFTIPFCLLQATSVNELEVLLLQLTPSDIKFPQLECLFLLSLKWSSAMSHRTLALN